MKKALTILSLIVILSPSFVLAGDPKKNLWAVGVAEIHDSAYVPTDPNASLLASTNGYAFVKGEFENGPTDDLVAITSATDSITLIITNSYKFIMGNPSRGGYLTQADANLYLGGSNKAISTSTAYIFVQPGIEVAGNLYSKGAVTGQITMSEKNSSAVSADGVFIDAPNKVEKYTINPKSYDDMKVKFDTMAKNAKILKKSSYAGNDFYLISSKDDPELNPTVDQAWKASDYPDGGVWYKDGDLTLGDINNEVLKMWGKGTILVNGDLTIYSSVVNYALDDMTGIGFMVTGKIFIKDPWVKATREKFQVIHGNFYAEGDVVANAVSPESIPLYIFGSMTANSFDFSGRR